MLKGNTLEDYETPEAVMDKIDPIFRPTLKDWTKKFKNTLEKLATHEDLSRKYNKLADEGKLHRHFESEAKFMWQFPEAYALQALPQADTEDHLSLAYDLRASWTELRTRHAREAFDFVLKHQEKIHEYYSNEVDIHKLKATLRDQIRECYEKNYEGVDAQPLLRNTLARADSYVALVFRKEYPQVRTRMKRSAEERSKREQSLLEAEARLSMMDTKPLLLTGLMELNSRRGENTGNSDSDVLNYLKKLYPETVQEYEKNKKHQPKPKPKARIRSKTPHPATAKTTSESRSSRPSSRSRTSFSDSKPQRSTSRPRSTSRAGSTRSRASSTRSSNKGKGKSTGKSTDKGKGKGKGKRKSFNKGRGKSR